MDANAQLFDWYYDMPIVTRAYFTASTLLTVLCALDVFSVYQLYYNARSIAKGDVSGRGE